MTSSNHSDPNSHQNDNDDNKKKESSSLSLVSLLQSKLKDAATSLDLSSSNSSVQSYLSSLSSLSLNTLKSQPDQLKQVSTTLESQLSDLCLKHVDSFINVHQSIQSLNPSTSTTSATSSNAIQSNHQPQSGSNQSLESISSSLSDILNNHLPNLESLSNSFKSNTSQSLVNRNKALNLKEQYSGTYSSSAGANSSDPTGRSIGGNGGLNDLLELPRLVETCILAKHYNEALKLGIHIAKLSSSSNGNSSDSRDPVLISLKEETWSHFYRMRNDLLENLKKPQSKLSLVRRTLTYLRKLSELDLAGGSHFTSSSSKDQTLGISESQLCLTFLRSRSSNLSRSLEELKNSNNQSTSNRGNRSKGSTNDQVQNESKGDNQTIDRVSKHLKDYIDTWRELVSETCALGLNLFVDSNEIQPSTSIKSKDEVATPLLLISAFSNHSLSFLKSTMESNLPLLIPIPENYDSNYEYAKSLEFSGMSLSNLFTQLSFASASFGRIGLDFGGILGIGIESVSTKSTEVGRFGPFVESSLKLFSIPIKNATNELCWILSNQSGPSQSLPSSVLLSNPSSRPSKSKLIQSLLDQDLESFSSSNLQSSDLFRLSNSSKSFKNFPPLISYLNSLISSFNALRMFPLISSKSLAFQELKTSFNTILKALDDYRIQLEEVSQTLLSDVNLSSSWNWNWDLPSLEIKDSEKYLTPSSEINLSSNLLSRRIEIEKSIFSRFIVLFIQNLIPSLIQGFNVGIYSSDSDDLDVLLKTIVGDHHSLIEWAHKEDQVRLGNEEMRKKQVEEIVRVGKAQDLERQREKEESERVERERVEEDQRQERERERLEIERIEKERLEKESLEQERAEKERIEMERLEQEKLEKDRLETERLEQERLEHEMLEKEKSEKERLEQETALNSASIKESSQEDQVSSQSSSQSQSSQTSQPAAPPKKLSLADKLKLKAEERERAKLAAQAKSEAAQPESTSTSEAVSDVPASVSSVEQSSTSNDSEKESQGVENEADETIQAPPAQDSEATESESPNQVQAQSQEEEVGKDDSNEDAAFKVTDSTNPSRAPSEIDVDDEEGDGREGSEIENGDGGGAENANKATKTGGGKKKKKKKGKK